MIRLAGITSYLCLVFLLTVSNIHSQILEPEEVYEKVNNSVVTIFAYDNENIKVGRGSGIIIDTGIVVTNFHVYQGSDRISVSHYGNEYEVDKIIGVDIDKDVIICKTSKHLLPIEIAAASDFRIGERIYAIGSPLGFENSITDGLISGFREIENNKLLQISAPISFGSSGGAVINSRGQLIGISSSGYIYSDINFAIPIDAIYNLSTNCSVEDTICSIKIEYFLECYQAYINIRYKEALIQLNNYILVDLGITLHKELENVLKIISLGLLFELEYTDTDLINIKTLFRKDKNFVSALDYVSLMKKAISIEVYEVLNGLLAISNEEPLNPHYYYCLGQWYKRYGDRKTQLHHYYKKAFFLGRKDLGSLLYKEGVISQIQWEQFR